MDFTAFAEAFARAKGHFAFGVPGGGPSLQLADALYRQGIEFITTGHETTAALMAGAVARQTDNPALAITIKGPGFANLAPGLLANAYEGYAHLAVAEAYPPGASGARKHKWLDHARAGGEFLKGYRHFSGSADFFDQCWQEAVAEFPGPVHIDLSAGGTPAPGPATAGGEEGVASLLGEVRAAQKPAVIVGSLALRAPWREALKRLQIPVFTTVAGKGSLAETSAFAAGVYTGDGKALTLEKVILPAADLVICIGVRSGEVLNPALPGSKCLVVESVEMLGRAVFPDNRFGDRRIYLSEAGLAELLAALENHSWGDKEIANAGSALERGLNRWSWSPARGYGRLQGILPAATHVLDTGNFTVLGEHCLRVSHEKEILGTPNGRYLGMGVGYALGASAVAGERPVVLWIGDGGLRAFFSELSLAVEQRWKLLVMVMKDGYFGSVRGRAISQGWTCEPLVMKDRSFARVAESMGMMSGQVASETALADWVGQWQKQSGPGLLECSFNADEYNQITELLR